MRWAVAALLIVVAAAHLWLHGVGQAVAPQRMPSKLHFTQPVDRPLRILALGTSLTARSPWPDLLEDNLRPCFRQGVQVERLAKPGANSSWGVDALRGFISRNPKPDILLIEFTANDASLARGVTLARSRKNHAAIVALARAIKAVPLLIVTNPVKGLNAWERPGRAAYEASYAALPTELIDLRPAWAAQDDRVRAALIPDGLHPSPLAARLITEPAIRAALIRLSACAAPVTPPRRFASLL